MNPPEGLTPSGGLSSQPVEPAGIVFYPRLQDFDGAAAIIVATSLKAR